MGKLAAKTKGAFFTKYLQKKLGNSDWHLVSVIKYDAGKVIQAQNSKKHL